MKKELEFFDLKEEERKYYLVFEAELNKYSDVNNPIAVDISVVQSDSVNKEDIFFEGDEENDYLVITKRWRTGFVYKPESKEYVDHFTGIERNFIDIDEKRISMMTYEIGKNLYNRIIELIEDNNFDNDFFIGKEEDYKSISTTHYVYSYLLQLGIKPKIREIPCL